jgi:type IV pilus assembly protein PilX
MNPQQTSGAGLVVALIMLVMMSAGAISLVRAVSVGRLMAANLAFRQGAVLASDIGSEAAIEWLKAHITSAALYADQPDQGYYASVPDGLDITGAQATGSRVAIDWDDDHCHHATAPICVKASVPMAPDAAGNVIRYAIHRLCRMAGSPQGGANNCLLAGGTASASSKRSSLSYGASSRFSVSMQVYYRITIRVRGPRNTVVLTQTLAHF